MPMVASADEPLPYKLTQRWESSAGHRGEEWLVGFSKDGKLAFFNQTSGRLIARDTTTWKKTDQVLVNEEETKARQSGGSVDSPDGRYRAQAEESYDKETRGRGGITLLDPNTKATLLKVSAVHQSCPTLIFSHDSKTLISAAPDVIILWDVQTMKKRRTLGPVNSLPSARLTRLVLSPDGGTLGVCFNYYKCEDQVWDLKTGKMKVALGGHIAQVWSVAFSPDGKSIASRGNDAQAKVWDVATGFNTMSIPLESGHAARPVAYSPDGQRIATADENLVKIFDAQSGEVTVTLKGHTSNVNALAFSPDGKQLVSASGVAPQPLIDREGAAGEVILWDLGTQKAKHTWKAHLRGSYAVAWSPDGTEVATAGALDPLTYDAEKVDPKRAIYLWDVKTGKQARSFPVNERHMVSVLAFSPDGKTLVHNADSNGTSGTRYVEVATARELRLVRGCGSAMVFSKDGSMLASVGGGYIGLIDPKTGEHIAKHNGDDMSHYTVAFHPDGKSLVTAGGIIQRWDIVANRKE